MKIQFTLFLFLLSFASTAQDEMNSKVLHPLEVYDGASALYLHRVVDIIEIDDGFIYINNIHTVGSQPQPEFEQSFIKKTDHFLNVVDSVDTQTLGLEIPGLILWGLTQDYQNDSLLHIWAGAEMATVINGRMKDFFVLYTNLDLEILSIDSFTYRETHAIQTPVVNQQGNINTIARSREIINDSLVFFNNNLEITTEGIIIKDKEARFISESSQIVQLADQSYTRSIGRSLISYDQELNFAEQIAHGTLSDSPDCDEFQNTVIIDSSIYVGSICVEPITNNPDSSELWWEDIQNYPVIGDRYSENIFRYENGEVTQILRVMPYEIGYVVFFNHLNFNFDAVYHDRLYTSAYYVNLNDEINYRLSLHASDETGALRWSKHFFHESKSYETYRVKALKDGGVLFIVEYNDRNPNFPIETDVVFMRFDENGNEYNGETTSVTDLDIPNVILYPNPAQERLYIQTESGRPMKELAVHGLDGKRLIQQTGQTNAVDLSALTQGMYILVANFSDGSVVREKFIKNGE